MNKNNNKVRNRIPHKSKLFILALIALGSMYLLPLAGTQAEAPSKGLPPASAPIMKLNDPLPGNLFIELNRVINPAVVNISTTSIPHRGMRDPMQEFFEQFYGIRPDSRPRRPQQTALGTGFIVREDGLIITNNHVVAGADIINVQLSEKDEKFYEAKLIGSDERLDIALIKINADKKLPVAPLGNSKDVEVGEWVAAFGNPFGHGHTMTKGIISSKGREIEEINKAPLLQTDASINPGNSGGPLVNTKGFVIGVNSAIDARAQGIGFAIPIDSVKSVLSQLEERGQIRKGYLGVGLGDLDPAAAEYLGLSENSGAVITEVQRGLPGHKAGLRTYDIVTEFNGKKIKNSLDLRDAVSDSEIGKKVKMKVLRDNKALNLEIAVAERAESTSGQRGTETVKSYSGQKAPFNLGFNISDLTEDIRKEWNLNGENDKPVVVEVQRNSIASRAGIRVGDIILDVNKQEIHSAADVIKALKKDKNSIRLARNNRILVVIFESK